MTEMLEEAGKIALEAGKDAGVLIGKIGLKYLSNLASDCLRPILHKIATRAGGKDEKKEEKGEKKKNNPKRKALIETFPCSVDKIKDKEVGAIYMEQVEHKIVHPREGEKVNPFHAYNVMTVRVDKELEDGKDPVLFILGRDYWVRYGTLNQMFGQVKDSLKEVKFPDMPSENLLGMYCGCLQGSPDITHPSQMSQWIATVQSTKELATNKVFADFWYMGDSFETQQRLKEVFDRTFQDCIRDPDICKDGYTEGELPPFNEREAVVSLAQQALVKGYIDKVLTLIPGYLPGPCKAPVEKTLAATLYTAIDKAVGAAWEGLKIGNVTSSIADFIEKYEDKIVSGLEGPIGKIFKICVQKMDPDFKEEDEKNLAEGRNQKGTIGDIAKKWKLEKTEPGKAFQDALNDNGKQGERAAKNAPSHAVGRLREAYEPALKKFFAEKVNEAVGEIFGKDVKGLRIVTDACKRAGSKIRNFLLSVTSIDAALSGLDLLDYEVAMLIKSACENKGDQAKLNDAVYDASEKMWKCLPEAALHLLRATSKAKRNIRTAAKEWEINEATILALHDTLDYLFHVQMRALNALRVRFTDRILEAFRDEKSKNDNAAVKGTILKTWAEELCPMVSVVVGESWKQVSHTIRDSFRHFAMQVFKDTLWGPIKELVKEFADAIESIGVPSLKIEALVLDLVDIIISLAIDALYGSMQDKLETILFGQE